MGVMSLAAIYHTIKTDICLFCICCKTNSTSTDPSVCPPFVFLPEPCVPECYYQCSATGVGYRYCCHTGTIWDDSIKNCNYPSAMASTPAPPSTSSKTTTMSQNGGNISDIGTTTATHQIQFMVCSKFFYYTAATKLVKILYVFACDFFFGFPDYSNARLTFPCFCRLIAIYFAVWKFWLFVRLFHLLE